LEIKKRANGDGTQQRTEEQTQSCQNTHGPPVPISKKMPHLYVDFYVELVVVFDFQRGKEGAPFVEASPGADEGVRVTGQPRHHLLVVDPLQHLSG